MCIGCIHRHKDYKIFEEGRKEGRKKERKEEKEEDRKEGRARIYNLPPRIS